MTELSAVFRARDDDWTMGKVVYQIVPDRFHARDIDAKLDCYAPPRRLAPWTEPAKRGEPMPDEGVWSHELTFYGGDLAGITDKLGYAKDLGADVILLTPVFEARTYHGYDTLDYHTIAPHLGTRDDLRDLVGACHRLGLRIILDGVFNHMSMHAPWFQEALADAGSSRREWFDIDPDRFEHGFRCWAGVKNLPEMQVEHEPLRDAIHRAPDSVVRSYLRNPGIDGWRLDVAWELGTTILSELVSHAHAERADSVVLGEIWTPPASPGGSWVPPLDGLLLLSVRELLLHWVEGRISGSRAARVLQTMVEDAGIEALLRSHIVVENHDTPRIHSKVPDPDARRAVQTLAAALPGNFSFLYGMEIGLEGSRDPEMRGPMPWSEVREDHPVLAWTKRLLATRRAHRAMRIGDYLALDSESLFAFQRSTDRYADTIWVMANASDEHVCETLYLRDARLMNGDLVDVMTGERVGTHAGFCRVEVASRSVRILGHVDHGAWQYDPYKRIR